MDIFRRRILAKLIIILVVAVSAISMISIIYFDKKNAITLRAELMDMVVNLREVARLAYAVPMWQMGEAEIAYLNRAILTNKNIVAVNIYDETGKFIEGLRKDLSTMLVVEDDTRTPFAIPEASKDIKKVFYTTFHRGYVVGSFEIFYTEQFVNKEIAVHRAHLAIAFTLIGLSMTLVIFVVVKKMLISPILTLADVSRKIRNDRDYSVKLEKRSDDEIGVLYESIADMLREIERNEAELRKTKGYLSNIIESMPSMLVSIDRNGTVTQWNQACEESTGLSADDVLGKNLWEATDFFNPFRDSIDRIIESNEPVHLHGYRFDRGGITYKDVSLYPLVSDGISGVVIRMDDVTELEQKENLLRQAQKMESIGTLTSGIAHDFNNILGGIIGNVSLIQYKTRTGMTIPVQELMEMMSTIDKASNRAADMVKQLLNLSSKKDISFSPIDLNTVIKNVLHICENTFDKVVALKVRYADTEAMMLGDHVQLEQVLLNLCINACHALTIMKEKGLEQGGTIRISLTRAYPDTFLPAGDPATDTGPYWLLSVEDNGVGIPESMLPNIFDPFFTTKGTGRGTGLGLAVVYNIVRQHSGLVNVISSEGQGTTFTCYFPCLDIVTVEKRAEIAESLPRGEGLILVVDDEAVMREVASSILDELGYRTLLADGGDEALRIFREKKDEIDMVLLDVIMPRRSGIQVYGEMKEIDPTVRVLFASGYWQDGDQNDVSTLKDAHFIQKPYTIHAIADAIRKRLS